MKKIILAGGTGFIGDYLRRYLENKNYIVEIVSRKPDYISWNPKELASAINGCFAVINLAGKPINCRHTPVNKLEIVQSRVNSTKLIGNAISSCAIPPELWINASATGIYLPGILPNTDDLEYKLGSDFLAETVRMWEESFFSFQLSKTRQIALRTSVVLGHEGGVFRTLSRLASFGLGGKISTGNQMFSWIHIEDYARIVEFVFNNKSLHGFVNCTSPCPVSNDHLMRELRRAVDVRFGIPAPKLAVVVGAKVLGTEPDLILNSSNIIPKKLTETGYQFLFPELNSALSDLMMY